MAVISFSGQVSPAYHERGKYKMYSRTGQELNQRDHQVRGHLPY